jgi:hypothetical protein
MKRDISTMQEELLRLEASFGKNQEERDPQVAFLLTTATTTTIPAVTSFTGKRDRNSFEHGPQPQSIHPNKIPTCPNCGNQGHRGNNCPEPKHQCTYCQILGHQEPFCLNKQRDKEKYSQNGTQNNNNGGGKKNFRKHSGGNNNNFKHKKK